MDFRLCLFLNECSISPITQETNGQKVRWDGWFYKDEVGSNA